MNWYAMLAGMLRRALGYRLSVEQLIEIGLWLAIPYLLIGVVWAFLHPLEIAQMEDALLPRIPAGANIISFGLMVGLWPLSLLTLLVC